MSVGWSLQFKLFATRRQQKVTFVLFPRMRCGFPEKMVSFPPSHLWHNHKLQNLPCTHTGIQNLPCTHTDIYKIRTSSLVQIEIEK